MKFVQEKDIPERMRLLHPEPPDLTVTASRILAKIEAAIRAFQAPPPAPVPVMDTAAILQQLQVMQHRPPPAKATSWRFTITRDDEGRMTTIIATPIND